MDNPINRPDNNRQNPPAAQPGAPLERINRPNRGWVVNLVIIALVVAVVLYLLSALTPLNILGLNKGGSGDRDAWKAVFLTNEQVYFGHVASETADPVVLTDIYYLQITQPLQQVGADQNPPNLSQPQLSLVKLGNELHGPQDEMRISREHVLFVENLKPESRVVEAIDNYVAGNTP